MSDVLVLPDREAHASYDQLLSLLRARRSCRRFTAADVSDEDVERILDATSTAPMGLPPSDVGVLAVGTDAELDAAIQEARLAYEGVE